MKKITYAADVLQYNALLQPADQEMANHLMEEICSGLQEAENKVWHAHPVWFLEGNPIVGYSKQKKGMRLMFWSGADFDEEKLVVRGTKFKDASIFYRTMADIDVADLRRWLEKSRTIQWDYKNIVKRKGVLVKI
ncbi:DUF1801 domain-containing protein [Sphingobacterium psychroaquaticum]|uniref:YdhG-like domain-containing protein n=1 Tax=Sphingobacterium psychroaquaticum TaxID=561061 RepID=A0A1X7J0R4_9SPHI|nr:DUF1801 domain-containing protein [Sphingobacterium psychroaquaticum]SMG21246.1 protein of unknown function (DU1801) [Sphingobacterium psychroaquaticum]